MELKSISKEYSRIDIFIICYYAALVALSSSWTSVEAPSAIVRYGGLLAILLPLFLKNICLYYPTVATALFTIATYGFAYSVMPYSCEIYVCLAIMIVAIRRAELSYFKPYTFSCYIFLLALSLFVNFVSANRLENISSCLAFSLFLPFFISNHPKKGFDLLSYAFITASFVLALLFLIFQEQFTESYNTMSGLERAGWIDPNYFGTVLGLGFTVALLRQLLPNKDTFILRIFSWATIAISAIVIVLVASRGAVLAITGVSIISVLVSKINSKYKIVVIVLMVAIVYYMYNSDMFELLMYRIQNDSGTGSGRTTIWSNKLEAFETNANVINYFLGFGLSEGVKLGYSADKGMHNDFLAFFVEYGFCGFIIFVMLILKPLFNSTKVSFPYILAATVYVVLVSFSLEPLSQGRWPFWAFLFWIITLNKALDCNNKA